MSARPMGIYDLGSHRGFRSLLVPAGKSACGDLARALRASIGCGHVFPMETGRMALLAALRLMSCRGRQVLVNAYTTDVVHNTIRAAGAHPVFFDISPLDFSPRMDTVESALSGNTAAVIHTGLFGFPSDPSGIRELADSRGIPMLEDACNSLGCRIGEKQAGTLGDAGILSFRVGKPLSSGGGALIVNNPGLLHEPGGTPLSIRDCPAVRGRLRLARVFADYMMLSPFFMRYIGRPVRTLTKGSKLGKLLVRGGVVDTASIPGGSSELAGMGSAQCRLAMLKLSCYPDRMAERAAWGLKLADELKGLPLLSYASRESTGWNGLFFPVLLQQDCADAFQRFMRGKGIDVSRFHHEVPMAAAGHRLEGDFPGTAALCRRLVCLPCPGTESGRHHLTRAVREFFRGR